MMRVTTGLYQVNGARRLQPKALRGV